MAAVVLIPVGLSFAGRNGLGPVVMRLAMATGGSAGSFAPISLFGIITTSIAGRSGIDVNVVAVDLALGVVLSLCYAERPRRRPRRSTGPRSCSWAASPLRWCPGEQGPVRMVAQTGAVIPIPVLGGLISAFGFTTSLLAIIIPLALPRWRPVECPRPG